MSGLNGESASSEDNRPSFTAIAVILLSTLNLLARSIFSFLDVFPEVENYLTTLATEGLVGVNSWSDDETCPSTLVPSPPPFGEFPSRPLPLTGEERRALRPSEARHARRLIARAFVATAGVCAAENLAAVALPGTAHRAAC